MLNATASLATVLYRTPFLPCIFTRWKYLSISPSLIMLVYNRDVKSLAHGATTSGPPGSAWVQKIWQEGAVAVLIAVLLQPNF